MTRTHLGLLSLLLGQVAGPLGGTVASFTFPPPNPGWLVVTLNGAAISDIPDDGLGHRDIVGDATYPLLWVAADSTHLYFRMQTDIDTRQTSTDLFNYTWGCYVDLDDDLTTYEFSMLVEGASTDHVRLYANTFTSLPDSPADLPDLPAVDSVQDPLTAGVGHAQVVPAPWFFGGHPDFFLDWAFDLTVVEGAGFDPEHGFRIYCASGNGTSILDADCTGASTSGCPLSSQFSDPLACGIHGCYHPALLFEDGFESRNTLAWSAEAPALEAPDVYRWSDLDLRDPHVFANLPVFGCQDVTDTTPLGAQFSVNAQIQQAIATDSDATGGLDLSSLLAFRPFDALANAGRLDVGEGDCPAPNPPASCDWRMPPVPTTVDYDGLAAGTCLEPIAGTTGGYSPAISTATAPCYVSEPVEASILLLGAHVPLRATRSAAQFDANSPPTALSPGLWTGFLRESDADEIVVNAPSIGDVVLSSLLPGGTGNCAVGEDDRDVGPLGESGWWVYFNFTGSPVNFVGR